MIWCHQAFLIFFCRHSSSVKGEHGTQEETKEGEGAGIGEDEMSGCLIMSVWMEIEDLSCTFLKLEIYFIIAFTYVLGYRVEFDKLYKCIQTKIALELMHFNF